MPARLTVYLCLAIMVFLPGISNYLALVYKNMTKFWRVNVQITAWWQVAITALIDMISLLYTLFNDPCTGLPAEEVLECQNMHEGHFLELIFIIGISLTCQIYFGYVSTWFVEEWVEANKE